jgi:ABC-type nitrate/sulfonate/bicarbonate transport system ATPase subunit
MKNAAHKRRLRRQSFFLSIPGSHAILKKKGVKEDAACARTAARSEARALLPAFGLDAFSDSYPIMLSGGMRQRASFLRTSLAKKQVMLLDEPFGKLDALTRIEIQQWLMEMWQSFHYSVLFVTHGIDEAILLSDRIYVFSSRPGTIIAEVAVPIKRPRRASMATEDTFIQIKASC